jgi:hypothetical protein
MRLFHEFTPGIMVSSWSKTGAKKDEEKFDLNVEGE